MLVRMMPQFNYDNRDDYVIDRALPYVRWIFLGEEEEERERERERQRETERGFGWARLGNANELKGVNEVRPIIVIDQQRHCWLYSGHPSQYRPTVNARLTPHFVHIEPRACTELISFARWKSPILVPIEDEVVERTSKSPTFLTCCSLFQILRSPIIHGAQKKMTRVVKINRPRR